MPLRRNLEDLGGLLGLLTLGDQLEVSRAQLQVAAYNASVTAEHLESDRETRAGIAAEVAELRAMNETLLQQVSRQNEVIASILAALAGDSGPLDALERQVALQAESQKKAQQLEMRRRRRQEDAARQRPETERLRGRALRAQNRRQAADSKLLELRAEGLVELNVIEASSVLGVRAADLREDIKMGRARGERIRSRYIAHIPRSKLLTSGVDLTLHGAAEVEGVTTHIIRRRIQTGAYPNARKDTHGAQPGWRVPVGDLLPAD